MSRRLSQVISIAWVMQLFEISLYTVPQHVLRFRLCFWIYIYLFVCCLFCLCYYGLRTIAEPMFIHLSGIIMLTPRPTLKAEDLLTLKNTFRRLRELHGVLKEDDKLDYIENFPKDPQELIQMFLLLPTHHTKRMIRAHTQLAAGSIPLCSTASAR